MNIKVVNEKNKLANIWYLHDTIEDTSISEDFILQYYWNDLLEKIKKMSSNYYKNKEEWFMILKLI